jgi:hypothetical protein
VDIDRRRLLYISGCAVLAGVAQPAWSRSGIPASDRWHPLTRTLLERAARIGQGFDAPDRGRVERAIRQFADRTGQPRPLVIKWMETPADAFDHLSQFGLDALLDMGSASFWRRAESPASDDVDAFDRAFEVRMTANELLRVDEHDRLLMAPKLRAKSRAVSAGVSDRELFRVRAVSAQIGWLETSMADAAAHAISDVELLLSAGASVSDMAIDHQFMIFESCEQGLLATWETPDALICALRKIPQTKHETI